MTKIRPFRGLRYNPDKFCGDFSEAITQPYDRIHEAEQAQYYGQSAYSLVRIIQGLRTAGEPEANKTGPVGTGRPTGEGEGRLATDSVYTRARAYAELWQVEQVLIRDPEPALYVLEQRFTTPDGVEHVRRGLMAALELTRFDEGVVLPHERTLEGPKVDRLNLTMATQTAWGHIFMLYPDAQASVNALLQPFLDTHMPAILHEGIIEPEVEQVFWVVNDPDVIDAVVAAMATCEPLIIADGHHRYETALAYRDIMRAEAAETQSADAPADAAFNYAMVTFVSMDDPGLVVLPTHRLIHSYKGLTGPALLEKLGATFTVDPMPNLASVRAAMAEAPPEQPRFGFYDGEYALLTLKSLAVMDALLPDRDPTFRSLDVAVLHELVLERTMGLSKESVLRRENLDYLRDPIPGLQAVDRGEANFLFLLNPTRMDQIRECTDADECMPQKSTDFYPKVVSGLVMLPLSGAL
ncbi:MAG: DUF1015 domain-containing protein [Anaerolineae bacterium]|jgi:uncharacterized protein (DUF1015 family)|nr:DUF1015 domain-containing protein [Anaerolineae bacterium]